MKESGSDRLGKAEPFSAQFLPALRRVHSAGKYLLALRRINNLQVLSGEQRGRAAGLEHGGVKKRQSRQGHGFGTGESVAPPLVLPWTRFQGGVEPPHAL